MTVMKHHSERYIGPAEGHHLFGFHDVSPWSARHDALLALQVRQIDAPPGPGEFAAVGTIDPRSNGFAQHDETTGWNFPQGARQVWLHDRCRYAYNCPDHSQPRCRIRSQHGRLLHEIPWGVAAVSPVGDELYSIDFGRVHRLGGYGHVGSEPWGDGCEVRRAGGVVAVDIRSGQSRTIISLDSCRRAAGWFSSGMPPDSLCDYVTHVDPSPDGRRLAFLHRMWVADGGMVTTLCVADLCGRNDVRCLAQGSLSHFTWRDEHALVIWGHRHPLAGRLRGLLPSRWGIVGAAASLAKKILRPL